ncbi:MAG: hypothetical protein VX966_01200 [Chloroflexota bacterium]|nr:hypothetical protein [Chloroflexota bacterium]
MKNVRIVLILIPSILLVFMTVSCIPDKNSKETRLTQEVRGHVVQVVPRNISEFETLRIKSETQKYYEFTSQGFTGFTPSHIKEHQLFGQTLLVKYVNKNGNLIAIALED